MTKQSRAHFKIALRQCKLEQRNKNTQLVTFSVTTGKMLICWVLASEITAVPTTIADVTGVENIFKMWYNYYSVSPKFIKRFYSKPDCVK